jgi:cytidine deaminase
MLKETELAGIPVKEMIEAALEARKKAYAPYSHYQVGAALLTEDNRLYTGCNVENAAYSPGICAERTAMVKAVSEGCLNWQAILICGGPQGEELTRFAFPCGVCRQVMREFVIPEKFIVISAKSEREYQAYRFAELFPESFGPADLSMSM